MSETKFTPGPWHWVDHGSFINIESKDCNSIASLFSYATPEIEEPNAHLIAAAPDMYEELECARDVFRFYQSHHEFKGGTEKAIRNKEIADRIDRLLAKARGEA